MNEMSTGYFGESASLICLKSLAVLRADQSNLFLSACSVYTIEAMYFGMEFLVHFVTMEIALSMLRNLHLTSKFLMKLYIASLDLQCIVC